MCGKRASFCFRETDSVEVERKWNYIFKKSERVLVFRSQFNKYMKKWIVSGWLRGGINGPFFFVVVFFSFTGLLETGVG